MGKSDFGPFKNHFSFWQKDMHPKAFPAYEEGDSFFDVAVIGGGIAGMASAYLLSREGLSVAVLEAENVGGGVTGKTSAHISYAHECIYRELIRDYGVNGADLYARANLAALEKIASIVEEAKISCDFRRVPQYLYVENKANLDNLKKEFDAVRSLHLPVDFEKSLPLPFMTYGAIKFRDQAQFHPRKFILGLAQEIERAGGRIFENTRVLDVKENQNLRVITGRGVLRAKNAIVATHFPILDRGLLFARMKPERSYALAVRVREKIPEELFVSIDTPYRSIRTQRDGRRAILIVDGESHATGEDRDTAKYHKKLQAFLEKRFAVVSYDYYWSTQDNYPFDKLPFIGQMAPNRRNLLVATGFKGWGMTQGMLSGMLLGDIIMRRKNPWIDFFSPQRLNLKASVNKLVKENLKVFRTRTVGRFNEGREENLAKLKTGQAKKAESGGKKIAVYKDGKGKTHKVSPVCTHMGCIVNWNNAEESWDCPCHGSRYDKDGKLLHGPAVKDLDGVD